MRICSALLGLVLACGAVPTWAQSRTNQAPHARKTKKFKKPKKFKVPKAHKAKHPHA